MMVYGSLELNGGLWSASCQPFYPREKPPVPVGEGPRRTSEPVWLQQQRKKSLPLPGIETTIQNIANYYTDGAIPLQNENSSVTLDFRV
jgi:hypothetical protein